MDLQEAHTARLVGLSISSSDPPLYYYLNGETDISSTDGSSLHVGHIRLVGLCCL